MSEQPLKRTVLVIDDDDDMAYALSRTLEGAGFQVRRAEDGDEGVRMAAAEPPDAILLDFMMPVKNGFEACREIRRIPALRSVPILALTAFGQDIGEIHGMSLDAGSGGIQGCMEKPFEPNLLLERLTTIMG